ncbi:MAG: phage holin family protein [Terricaulis sp.]
MIGERTLPDLTRDLVTQLGDLVSNEAKLARVEVSENFRALSGGLVKLVFAAALAAAAVTLGLFALAYALAEQMPMWGAALIAAAVGGAISYFVFKGSRKTLSPDHLALPRTAAQVSRDVRLVKEHVPS